MASGDGIRESRDRLRGPLARLRSRAIAAFVTVNTYQRQASWARGFFGPELEHLADDPRVPVLSDETLCGDPFQRRYNGSDVADRIHQVFPRAKVLIGIREQKAIAVSSYREYIFEGGTLSLTDFIGTGHESLSYTPILREDFLTYDLVVNYYQELYGPENVLVLPIERLQRDRSGFVQSILDFCCCPGRLTLEANPAHAGWSALAEGPANSQPANPDQRVVVGTRAVAQPRCQSAVRRSQSPATELEPLYRTTLERPDFPPLRGSLWSVQSPAGRVDRH